MRRFEPPRRVLMGPGPSEVSPRVLQAAARPTIGHLDPAFQALMEEIKGALARAFRAPEHACLPLPGPGTAAMEAALLNLLEPGDTAVVVVNGAFGGRMAEMAARAGAEVVRIEQAWGEAGDPARVEGALWARGAKVLAFVQAETSTGALTDPAPLCRMAREHGALSVVDCVTALGGVPVEGGAWDADVLYAGTQKCLSAPPGLAPLAVSRRALDVVRARRTPSRTWLGDLGLLMAYWGGEGGRTYHHTAPVNALYGLHEALLALEDEGLAASWARHRRLGEALEAGLAALDLASPVAPEHRMPQLTAALVPDGVDEAMVRRFLLERYGVEIGAGLGPYAGRVWRIGLMGASATAANVRLCLTALAEALAAQGVSVSARDTVAAADAVLVQP